MSVNRNPPSATKSTSMKREVITKIQCKQPWNKRLPRNPVPLMKSILSHTFSREHSTRMLNFKLEVTLFALIRPRVHWCTGRQRHCVSNNVGGWHHWFKQVAETKCLPVRNQYIRRSEWHVSYSDAISPSCSSRWILLIIVCGFRGLCCWLSLISFCLDGGFQLIDTWFCKCRWILWISIFRPILRIL